LIKLIVLSLFIFPVEQITFPDYAAVLSVKTYLHMCGLKFTTVLRTNAADMSPSGKNSINKEVCGENATQMHYLETIFVGKDKIIQLS